MVGNNDIASGNIKNNFVLCLSAVPAFDTPNEKGIQNAKKEINSASVMLLKCRFFIMNDFTRQKSITRDVAKTSTSFICLQLHGIGLRRK
ncbi:hypothetical protein AGMMS49992_21140 [Clostridia bacterium]|nr:hypothetical protein AGMMS49992_21140 [Clostridia bacterium]